MKQYVKMQIAYYFSLNDLQLQARLQKKLGREQSEGIFRIFLIVGNLKQQNQFYRLVHINNNSKQQQQNLMEIQLSRLNYKSIVQKLYQYKVSAFFKVHLICIIILGIYILLLQCSQRNLFKEAYQYPTKSINKKVPTEQLIDRSYEQTSRQVHKLKTSQAYRKYVKQRDDPNSFYNRQIQVSDIEFSDEEDEKFAKRKNR